MNTLLTKFALLVCIISVLCSCGDNKDQFVVQGTITDADSLMLYLEQRGHSDVTILDSVRLNKAGDFKFKHDALPYAEFFKLRIDNQSVNFSIDSTETITITGSKLTLSTQYEVEGSYSSQKIKESVLAQVNLMQAINALREQHNKKELGDVQFVDSIQITLDEYKDVARNMILNDHRSTAAYFVLFQKIEDMLLFDPSDKSDLSLYRAVATYWDTYSPESPRSIQLKNYTLKAIADQKAINKQQETIEKLATWEQTNNKDFFTITLPDVNDKEISTKSFEGKVAVLDFTAYGTKHSGAHNIRLNQVYEKYKSKIEIYQISFDNDKHVWLNTAINLPWTCVRDDQALKSPLLLKFNVQGLPATYILNKDGEIVKRLSLTDNLEAEVAKVL